jgi:hypothetical protein
MRDNPDKYSCLVYSNNPMSIRDNNCKNISSGGQKQQSQYDDYSIGDFKTEILDQAKEFYTFLVGRFVCEVINGSITNGSRKAALPSALQLDEADSKQEHNEQK